MADAIAARLSAGAYDTTLSDPAFAATLTADLRSVTADRHLAVMANLPADAPKLSADPLYALRRNYGVRGVRVLRGNVGVIELDFAPNLSLGDAIVERYAAAMALVQDTRALIVDVRGHIGGEPETVAYFASYFFERPSFVVNRIRYRNQATVDYWTVVAPRARAPPAAASAFATLCRARPPSATGRSATSSSSCSSEPSHSSSRPRRSTNERPPSRR